MSRVAIVTGASGGVGRAYALALAGAGYTVVAAARTLGAGRADERNTLAEVVHSARDLPGRVVAQRCDLMVEADIANLVKQAMSDFGRLDVLVNNAGAYPRHGTLAIDAVSWDAIFDLNLKAAYLTIRETAPHMIAAGSGSIVNITAAAAGFFPKGHGGHEGLLLYAVSKAGLNRLTTFMAEELREHRIAVNALSPGIVRTDAWTLADERLGGAKPAHPDVLGPALLRLADQKGGWLSGQILHTDEFGKSWA